jgi:hypothetical protein
MQTYYSLTQFFNAVALAHPNITTFTTGDIYNVDMSKQTLFPLCHLIVNNVTIGPGTMVYNINLIVMDRVVNVTAESSGIYNELLRNYKDVTNVDDVWNTSLMTLNDIVSYVTRNPQALDYQINTDVNAVPFTEKFDNTLSGWQAVLNISVANTANICSVINISDVEAAGGTYLDPVFEDPESTPPVA